MTTGLLIIHIVLAAAMIGIILLQRSEGGGLGMNSSSMGGLMTTRGTANLLTRTTGVLAACFFTTTIILALMFKGAHNTKSMLDDDLPVVDQTVSAPIESDPLKDTAPLTAQEAKALNDPAVNNTIIDESQSISKNVSGPDATAPELQKLDSANKVAKTGIKKTTVKK